MSNDSTAGISEEIGAEIKSQIIRAVISTIIFLLGLAALGWWFYLKPKIPGLFGGLPLGAVVAFDARDGCPDSTWSPFTPAIGRVIIGATLTTPGFDVTNLDEVGNQIPPVQFSKEAGLVSTVINRQNLPEISIPLYYKMWNGRGEEQWRLVLSVSNTDFDGATRLNLKGGGESAPLSNLMPYVALTYCRKVG